MRLNYLLALLALVAVLAGAAYFAYRPLAESITLGLDIKGGITVLLEAVESEGSPKIDDDAMDRAVAVLNNRINGLGVVEPQIQREGTNRIRISLPGYKDQEKARELLGKTALLEFRDMEGNVFLTGNNLKDAREQLEQNGSAYVAVKLDEEGGRKMLEYTTAHKDGYLLITLDGTIISYPRIDEPVGAEGVIRNIGTLEEARNLAIMLRSGALPVELKVQSFQAVGPTLGSISLQQSIKAGVVGIALVLLFMVIMYRAFGLLADVALALYALLTLGLLAGIGATLTLPGIAGLVLGIGMAVDANIIIFERIKDELRHGRSIRASVIHGFRRALLTVADANITTLIAAGVLYYFGTGPIRGFAVTLSLGIIVSMFTAVVFTRLLVNLLVGANLTKSPAILGVGEVAK